MPSSVLTALGEGTDTKKCLQLLIVFGRRELHFPSSSGGDDV